MRKLNKQNLLTMKWIILSLIALSTLPALAQQRTVMAKQSSLSENKTSFSLELVAEPGSSFVLKIDNPQRSTLSIRISHAEQGTALESNRTNSASFGCRYRFDQVDDGKYLITVSNGKEKITKEIAVNTVTQVNRSLTVL